MVNGLDRQPVDFIANKITELGFNCVRLVFALDNIFLDPVIKEERLSSNPDLVGMTSMEVFDRTVQVLSNQPQNNNLPSKALTDAKLIILLNNHISTAMWCCSYDDGEGLCPA